MITSQEAVDRIAEIQGRPAVLVAAARPVPEVMIVVADMAPELAGDGRLFRCRRWIVVTEDDGISSGGVVSSSFEDVP